MSKVILLNGCGSAGKTSIARSLQHLSNTPWLTFGVDTFIEMLPPNMRELYFKFISGENDRGPTVHVESGPNANKIFGLMPRFAKLLVDEGHNLIIDEVLFDESQLNHYVENLSNHTVYYIGVFCDLNVMQEREILRNDRCIGLSNDQIDRVHQDGLGFYDFKVDTTHCSAFQAARDILNFISDNLVPEAAKEWRQKKNQT
jgi:chloramphenicol 3-O phosphotransferase